MLSCATIVSLFAANVGTYSDTVDIMYSALLCHFIPTFVAEFPFRKLQRLSFLSRVEEDDHDMLGMMRSTSEHLREYQET